FFFSSRRRHTRFSRDWSSDVCSSDLGEPTLQTQAPPGPPPTADPRPHRGSRHIPDPRTRAEPPPRPAPNPDAAPPTATPSHGETPTPPAQLPEPPPEGWGDHGPPPF